MSEETNKWRKRLITSLLCPSGSVATVRRAGPDLAIKAGKFARVLQKVTGPYGNAPIEEQLAAIEKLPDAELEQLMAFARAVVADVVVEPRLSLKPEGEQLSPDDVPLQDFWFIYTWAMNGGPTMPVKLKEGETTVEAVETFPGEQGSGALAGADSEQVQ
jgi:hypothetical protein